MELGSANHIILCNPKDAEFYGLFALSARNTVARLLRMKIHFTVKTKLKPATLACNEEENEKMWRSFFRCNPSFRSWLGE